jgi:hypothetical protein
MSNVNKNITVKANLISPPTYIQKLFVVCGGEIIKIRAKQSQYCMWTLKIKAA